MNHTAMIPAKLNRSTSRVPGKLLMTIAVIIVLAFFGLVIKFNIGKTIPEKKVVPIHITELPDNGPTANPPTVIRPAGPIQVEVSEHAVEKMDENTFRIYGRIRNIGVHTIEGLALIITLLDDFDEPVFKHSVSPVPRIILPGEYARFSIIFKDVVDFERYTIGVAQPRRDAIPEG